MVTNQFKIAWLVLLAFISTGCASVGVGGRKQVIKVTSEPPGAEILYKGKNLGRTPKYIKMQAQYKPEFKLRSPDGTKKVTVRPHTSYRWGKSFWSNFVFLTYAPIGWAIDGFTGAAWQLSDPKTVKFPEDQSDPYKVERPILAISPPVIGSPDFSDQIAFALETQLRSRRQFQVMSYEATKPLFDYLGDGDPIPEDQELKEELFFQLKNKYVLNSSARLENQKFLVSAEIQDVHSNEVVDEFEEVFEADAGEMKAQMFMTSKIGRLFYFLPNTMFVNFGSPNQSADINNQTYEAKIINGDGFFDEVLQVVERINISRLEPYQKRRIAKWSLKFIPDINISSSDIEYLGYSPLEDVSFERTLLSVGYGLRLAYLASWGRPYFDLIPHFGWTQIKSSGGVENVNLSKTSGHISAEFGYVYFMTSNWVLKIFARTFDENRRLWEEAIQRTTASNDRVTRNNSGFGGISIGYHFGLKSNRRVLRKANRQRK